MACGDILLQEPPSFDSWEVMAQWPKKKLQFLKSAMETKAEVASRAAMEHPVSILQEVEKVNISVGI